MEYQKKKKNNKKNDKEKDKDKERQKKSFQCSRCGCGNILEKINNKVLT